MVKYSIEHIAGLVHGTLIQLHHNDGIEQLLADSRKLIFPSTSLFFALAGPRRDGHLFIEELYGRGVRNFVVSRQLDLAPFAQGNFILVSDGLAALQDLAAFHRSQFEIPVIGITGSNGKTIVKEWLNLLLEDRYNIVRSPKSYNSQIGVPLSVWQMNPASELAIFEAGISQVDEMERLEKIIRPTVGVFTNIGEAHSEGFANMEKKIKEKAKLFSGAKTIVYNQDITQIAVVLAATGQPQQDQLPGQGRPVEFLGWGKDSSARVLVEGFEKSERDTRVDLQYHGNRFSVSIPFTDEASIENAMHCICVLLHFQTPVTILQQKIPLLSAMAMRLELKSGINNCSVINDSYSVDLSSLRIALDFLSQQQQHEKKTVILSDILQSGRAEADLYAQIARLLQEKGVTRLVAIGEKLGSNKSAFSAFFSGSVDYFSGVDEFISNFGRLQFRDESILIKGARVFQFERIDRLLSQQIHQTVMEINLNAMAHNLKQFQQMLLPQTKLMAMVKAFAYGSGTFEIANLLQFHGVDYLAVAYADEGVELRKAGIRLPVMVMNPEDSSFEAMLQYNLEPVVYSFGLLHAFDSFLKQQAMQDYPVHIEMETGMNRLGFALGQTEQLLDALKHSAFKIQSVFSHLAASEEEQHDQFTSQQADLFLRAAARLQQEFSYPIIRHIANTAAIVRHPSLQLDMVRLGIGLYGISSAATASMNLQEVSCLKSTIAQIKHLDADQTIGYNRTGVVQGKLTMATVRIGYADGYPRSLGNGRGKMWVRGYMAPIIGSICMDMTMLDITGIPGVKEGDEVLLFGQELSVQQVAHWAQTIPYEILTGISQRVKRIYFEE